MFSPERLNVLLSRSRNGLIMIGNMGTFQNARKGKDMWTKLFNMLSHSKHIYEGLPVKCEQHPDKTLVIPRPDDFDVFCPDGGCDAPWYVIYFTLFIQKVIDCLLAEYYCLAVYMLAHPSATNYMTIRK